MGSKNRIILLQKQIAIAVKALKGISEEGGTASTADFALEEIERIRLVQEGREA